jgi:hypothetical protein
MHEGWIDINHFAEKYGVSVSTLRRRIRGQSIEFKLDKGRYLLPDTAQTLGSAPLFSRQLVKARSQAIVAKGPAAASTLGVSQRRPIDEDLADPVRDFLASDQILPVTLVADFEMLKKENRKLKSQVAELETYIKALEAEVDSQ